MGLAVRQVRLHRGLVVQPAVQHIIIAGLSFLVKLRVPQIAFRRLEGLPGEQDFPLCFKLPENAVLQPGKLRILIRCKPTLQHFRLRMGPALTVEEIIHIRPVCDKA